MQFWFGFRRQQVTSYVLHYSYFSSHFSNSCGICYTFSSSLLKLNVGRRSGTNSGDEMFYYNRCYVIKLRTSTRHSNVYIHCLTTFSTLLQIFLLVGVNKKQFMKDSNFTCLLSFLRNDPDTFDIIQVNIYLLYKQITIQ